ncbi:MAG: hydrolase TatD [Gammaproteobacteria bacterium]|nr:MAG: hydrolase TatD [Gammaproteobacteria bacterium]
MIDIGINFTNKSFRNQVGQAIHHANEAGVSHMIVTGTDVECSQAALALCKQHPETLFCTAGVHPHDSSQWNASVCNTIKNLLDNPEVVAVGETGLDFNRDFSPRDAQENAFREQLELAVATGKPLFLHERDAFNLQYAILQEYRDHISGGVQHCFTGTREALNAYLDLGLYIGITGWICDERRGQALQELVAYIPDDRLLIETDGPYLLPRDLKPKPKSRRNEPKYLPHIAQRIADLRKQPLEVLISHTVANSIRCFQLPLTHKPGKN